jgi:hypothetical protein
MRRLAALIVLAGALISNQSRADNLYFLSGNDLYAYCTEDAYARGICLGAASAYLDMMQVQGFSCNTVGVTRAQIRDVLIKYLRDYPASRNLSAAQLASWAFMSAFNCKQ